MRFCPASDQGLLVYLGEQISLSTHQHVVKLLRVLENKPPCWLRNLQPAYCSLLVTFDPCLADHAEVEAVLRKCRRHDTSIRAPKHSIVEIPVCYDEEFGPDLQDVAKLRGLTAEEVIHHHCSHVYHAYFLGFAPGFAYLGDLPEEIATPRLGAPRKQVPAGSVAIAGRQTAVYPVATPGGWRLLGRTPLRLFRADHKPMPLVSIGNQVRFRAIPRDEYHKWDCA